MNPVARVEKLVATTAALAREALAVANVIGSSFARAGGRCDRAPGDY